MNFELIKRYAFECPNPVELEANQRSLTLERTQCDPERHAKRPLIQYYDHWHMCFHLHSSQRKAAHTLQGLWSHFVDRMDLRIQGR